MYGGDSGLGGSRSFYDWPLSPNAPATEATFERIQFKNATANNGRRRATQQYNHLLIELFADIGAQYTGERWIKIASRMSVPMVVRGRPPGHYHNELRGSTGSEIVPELL
jgi:meiosis-specific transcription factor NDT80